MSSSEAAMTTFLTTRDVQDMIHVDRSTVYRMVEDGRLPAVKVGRQWRFPADRLAEQLGAPISEETSVDVEHGREDRDASDLGDLLVPEAAQAVADLMGELFGVMAVVTDMQGRPLTSVANPCRFFNAISESPSAVDRCVREWRHLGADLDFEPRFVASHLGFMCARTYVRVGSHLVGMLIVGGVAPAEWPPDEALMRDIAFELGLPVQQIADHIDGIWHIDADRQRSILKVLPRIGDLISQLASARSQLLARLDTIAGLAGEATHAASRRS